jgi:hypothetical protein
MCNVFAQFKRPENAIPIYPKCLCNLVVIFNVFCGLTRHCDGIVFFSVFFIFLVIVILYSYDFVQDKELPWTTEDI